MRNYHPYLFTTFFVLALYAANAGEVPATCVATPLVAVLLPVAAFHLAARWVWRTSVRPAVAATAFAIFLLAFEHVYSGLVWLEGIHGFGHIRLRAVLATWLLMLFGSLFAVHSWCENVALRKFLNRLGIALVILTLVNLAASQARTFIRQSESKVVSDNGSEGNAQDTIEKIVLAGDWAIKRDIFFLVFDRYASNETLKCDFNYDNTPFRKSLEERGFHWFSDSYTNYPKTYMSMAAALNMRYHEGTHSYVRHLQLIEQNAVTRFLKEQGYRYYHLGNWFTPLRTNPQADYTFTVSTLPSEFAELVYSTTPFGRVWSLDGKSALTITRQFNTLENISRHPSPKFVYAHFLVPHDPYLFGTDGPKRVWQLDDRTEQEQYVDQLGYTNNRILEAIDCILANSIESPVIVLQADEGPFLMSGDDGKTLPQQMRKRCGIMAAIRLPGDSAVPMPKRLSPVNTFRLILKHQACPALEILDDRVFYWAETSGVGDGNAAAEINVVEVSDIID